MSADKNFEEVIRQYSRITQFPPEYKKIFKIDKPMRWLFADKNNQYISFYQKNSDEKLLDVDITSCFPTICRFLFSEERPEFIERMEALATKREKNIYIANTLKTTHYLKTLNIISKMVILGFIFDRQDSTNTSLLEFEKDGCLIITTDNNIENCEVTTPFQEFITRIGFKFHTKKYNYYIRCNHTSWYWNEEDQKLKVKGIYKHIPLKIYEFYENLFKGITINIEELTNIYNSTSFKFIRKNNLSTLLEDYYYCSDNKRVLNITGKYEKYHWKNSQIDPRVYLYNFIFPVWLFYCRNLNSIL
jgi:hypothetical protein